jgi:hypothetical protein
MTDGVEKKSQDSGLIGCIQDLMATSRNQRKTNTEQKGYACDRNSQR